MKLCLVSINCNHRHYSLGVYVLAAMVRERLPQVEVRVLNFSVRATARHVLFETLAEPADVYGLSVHHGHGPRALELARDIRRLRPGSTIVVGGTDVPALDPAALAACADWCVSGEGEWALVELLRALLADAPPAHPALARAGQAALPAPRRQHVRLDDVPSPYLNGAFQAWERHPTVYVETYRGCVWNCSFCHEGRGRRGIASYSEERIRSELSLLLQRPGVRVIEFYDTIFNVEPARTRWLLDFLVENNRRGVRFIGEIMLEWLDDAEIDALGRAGFMLLEAGLQSTNRRTLGRVGRRTDLGRFADRARRLLERTGIDLGIDAMFGLEDETLADFTATLDWIGRLEGANGRRPTPILFATSVHPATRMFARRGGGLALDAAVGGRTLVSPTLSLHDTRRFYDLLYGYLCLRATFPATMNEVTGILLHRGGHELSSVYSAVAEVLRADEGTRVIFEQADWTEFRSSPTLRLMLDAIDRRYLLAVVDVLGAADAGLREAIGRCIEIEDGGVEPARA